jgi:aspartate aminotransferase-like enzyme
MNCPPGLGMVAVSNDAWAVMAKRKVRQSFSFDLYKYVEMWIPRERGGKESWGHRRHVVEPAPQLTYAMREGLKVILEEGLAERLRKNRLAGKAIRTALAAMGLEMYPLDERSASNTLTAILNPEGIKNAAIIETMRKDHGVIIGGGLEEVAGRVLRMAHMSSTSDEMHVLHAVRALEKTLIKLGGKIEMGSGVNAARAVFDLGGQQAAEKPASPQAAQKGPDAKPHPMRGASAPRVSRKRA